MKTTIRLILATVFLMSHGITSAQQLLYSDTFYQYLDYTLPQSCTFAMYSDHAMAGDVYIGLAGMNETFYDYRGNGIQVLWSPYVPGCVTLFINQKATIYMVPQTTIVPDYSGYYNVPNYGGTYSVPNYGGGYYAPNYGDYYNMPQRCLACHGTGRVERHIYSPGGGFYFCRECGRKRPNGHYHTNCSGCYGTGWLR